MENAVQDRKKTVKLARVNEDDEIEEASESMMTSEQSSQKLEGEEEDQEREEIEELNESREWTEGDEEYLMEKTDKGKKILIAFKIKITNFGPFLFVLQR